MANITNSDLILITGASGGLGVALELSLRINGYNNLLCPTRGELDLLSDHSVNSYFTKFNPKAVFHLASVVYGLQGNIQNQFKSVSENTRINDALMKGIANSQVEYLFFAGTVAAYPFPYQSLPLEESFFFNGLPHGGEFGYAMSKRHAYSYLRILNETNSLSYTYGILTNLYGEKDRFDINSGHVIPSLVAKGFSALQTKSRLSVWGDGSAIRDFLHFSDAANAIVHAMKKDLHGLLNISSGKGITIGEVSRIVAESMGLQGIDFLSNKPVGVVERVVSNKRLLDSGYSQGIDIETGLKNLCGWYATNHASARK